MPKKPKPRQLLVEGKNDRHVIWALCNQYQLPEIFSAEAILQEIEEAGLNCYTSVHRPKALIHTWLAWQETPGMPMGQAITARVLSHESPIAIAFVAWLQHLFELPLTSQ